MANAIGEIFKRGSLLQLLVKSNPEDSEIAQSQPINAALHMIQMSVARIQVKSKTLPSFQDTLMEMAGYDATDAHDRVYALLGLSSDRDNAELCPNYEISVAEAYIKTARHLLTRKKSILILHRAGIENTLYLKDVDPSESELPSWVPYWHSRPALEDALCFGNGWAKYKASGSYSPSVSSPEDNHETLVLSGILVDIIDEVSTLKEEQTQKLQESKQLHTAPQPAGKVSNSRLLDLEDERKITIQWVRDHQWLMKKSRLPSQGEAALALAKMPSDWKSEYERTITAAGLDASLNSAPSAELDTIWDHSLDHFGNPTESISILNKVQTFISAS
jgi:hypothetical protein